MTKSFTNYVDLKKAAMKDEVDLEAGLQKQGGVQLIRTEMGEIRDILTKLEQANQESKSLHKTEALKALRERINTDIVAVLKKAKCIRTQLEEMDRANAANRRLSGLKDGSPAIYRTRIAVTNGLRKKLKELMMEFQVVTLVNFSSGFFLSGFKLIIFF
jgi:syntaxin 1B/2/3